MCLSRMPSSGTLLVHAPDLCPELVQMVLLLSFYVFFPPPTPHDNLVIVFIGGFSAYHVDVLSTVNCQLGSVPCWRLGQCFHVLRRG